MGYGETGRGVRRRTVCFPLPNNVCARNPTGDYARIAIAFGQEENGKEEGVPVDASGLLGTAAEGVVEVDDGLHLAEAVTELGELRLQE